jgi:hypothetical protein
MTLSRRIAKIELIVRGKPALSPRLLALALAICAGEDGDL